MNPSLYLGRNVYRVCLPARLVSSLQTQLRTIATHTYAHHASALSVLPSNVDKSSGDYKENAILMGELLAQMQELHQRVERGGSDKARDKHIARGKMLPREYVARLISSSKDIRTNMNGK